MTMAKKSGKTLMLFEPTDAERQMIELLRESKHVTLTIDRNGDQWNMRLEDHDTGVVGAGAGPTFDRAWDDIVDPRLRAYDPRK
jgi:hypothetical protein